MHPIKETALRNLEERINNPPKKIDNWKLPAYAPMYYYCLLCDGEIVVPENWITKPDYCKPCIMIKEFGFLNDEEEIGPIDIGTINPTKELENE